MPPCCQSCGLPLKHMSDFGTEATGAINIGWCRFCFLKGKFTEPDITMEAMIEKVARTMAEQKKVPPEKAREQADRIIPKLKRWKKEEGRH